MRTQKCLLRTLCTLLTVLFSTSIHANESAKPLIDTPILSGGVLTNGYVHARAISDVLNTLPNFAVSIDPVADSGPRTQMLLSGAREFCICDMESYFAQEGLFDFARPDRGPSGLRLIMSAYSDFKLGLAIAKDSNAKSLTDLRGKRIPWIRGANQLNATMTAFLRFAGLNWEEVQKLTYPGYDEAMIGFARKQIDAIVISANLPKFTNLEKGRRPFFLADFNSSQKIAWRRMKSFAPYLQPVSSGNWMGVTHPYPLLLTTSSQKDETVYHLTKTISENLETITEILPNAEGWHTSWQNFKWVIPFHSGAVQYFQEIGIWSDQAQAHQDALIRRQNILIKAFADFKSKNPDPKTFQVEWQKFRELQLNSLAER